MNVKRWAIFIVAVAAGVLLDQLTKRWALAALDYGVTREMWGGVVKLTLSFNRGAAFGVHLGSASRLLFIVFTSVTLVWLGVVYHRLGAGHRARAAGIVLVCSGAVGNLIDRVQSARGVVDFLGPYDLGFMLWPIFNVADIFVVVGIGLLLLSLRGGSMAEPHPATAALEDASNEPEGGATP